MSDTTPTSTELGFSEALQELESILQQIDDDSISVDDLAEKLRKAKDLLELCRSKIRQAEVEVGQIVQTLDDQG